MSQLFTLGGQSIGVSALTSILPMNTQDWSPLGWTGWISLQSKGLSRVFSNTTVQKHQFRNHLDRNLYGLLSKVIFQEDFVFFFKGRKKSNFRLVTAYIHCETIVTHLVKVTIKDFRTDHLRDKEKLSPDHVQNSFFMVRVSQTSSLSVPTTGLPS